jgi:hypothetical protein
MAMGIVYLLEIVHVQNDHGHRHPEFPGQLQFPGQHPLKETPILQAGQIVPVPVLDKGVQKAAETIQGRKILGQGETKPSVGQIVCFQEPPDINLGKIAYQPDKGERGLRIRIAARDGGANNGFQLGKLGKHLLLVHSVRGQFFIGHNPS